MPAWPSLMTWIASAMRLERKAVGDDRARVELAGAEEAPHLVPGLVHLAAGDAVEREPLEDHVAGEVHLGRAAGRAQQVDPAARAAPRRTPGRGRSGGRSSRRRGRRRRRRSARAPGPARRRRPGLSVTCAPIARARSSRIGLKSLAITSDAPAARATPTAKQPIGPQPSTSTVLPGTSRLEHGVDRVAHRVHDGADLGGDAVEAA